MSHPSVPSFFRLWRYAYWFQALLPLPASVHVPTYSRFGILRTAGTKNVQQKYQKTRKYTNSTYPIGFLSARPNGGGAFPPQVCGCPKVAGALDFFQRG